MRERNHPNKNAQKGRAALNNQQVRFVSEQRVEFDDGWGATEEPLPALKTKLFIDHSKHIITYNQSPDVGFDRSINPYRGCEHGCIYCFARPTHAYLNLSPGLDFESSLFYKPDAPELLRKELAAKSYQPAPIALGINTDAYQPIEKQLSLTRQILEILYETRHPVTIVTKSALLERDFDILQAMAQHNLVKIMVSITTLDNGLARRMEPRACAPHRRLKLLQNLTAAKIPGGVLVAPVIPVLTDHELENILVRSRQAGALTAGYILIRLPHEIKQLFYEWLSTHYPDKAQHVTNRIRDCRKGRDYNAQFGTRMRGTGIYAELLQQRYKSICKKLGFAGSQPLNNNAFIAPQLTEQKQYTLF